MQEYKFIVDKVVNTNFQQLGDGSTHCCNDHGCNVDELRPGRSVKPSVIAGEATSLGLSVHNRVLDVLYRGLLWEHRDPTSIRVMGNDNGLNLSYLELSDQTFRAQVVDSALENHLEVEGDRYCKDVLEQRHNVFSTGDELKVLLDSLKVRTELLCCVPNREPDEDSPIHHVYKAILAVVVVPLARFLCLDM